MHTELYKKNIRLFFNHGEHFELNVQIINQTRL